MNTQATAPQSNAQSNTTSQSAEEKAIWDKLDAIFGTPKELNKAAQEQANTINQQIDSLLTNLGTREPTKEEEKQLTQLSDQLDSLYGVKSYDSLSAEEKAQADALFTQLDKFAGDINPEIDALYKQLDVIFGTPKELNAKEQEQADAIMKQIDQLFETSEGKELTKAEQTQVDQLSGQLDTLYGVKSYDDLPPKEQQQVESIFQQLDKLEGTENGEAKIDAETEALFNRLDEIFGTPKELTDEKQKQADVLEAQIDKLFSATNDEELSAGQSAQLDTLFNQLDELYGIKSYDKLTEKEKQEVDSIFAKLETKEETLDDKDFESDMNFGNGIKLEDTQYAAAENKDSAQAGNFDEWGSNDWNNASAWASMGGDNSSDMDNGVNLTGQTDTMQSMDVFDF